MKQKIEGRLSISRPSYGDGTRAISIRLRDAVSRTEFAEVSVGLQGFAEAVTGLSEVPVSIEVKNLDRVGKLLQRESRQIVTESRSRDQLVAWLAANAQESGWILDSRLDQQGSVKFLGGGRVQLNYAVYRYIGAPDQQSVDLLATLKQCRLWIAENAYAADTCAAQLAIIAHAIAVAEGGAV